jgi:dephospho-CoA kinase
VRVLLGGGIGSGKSLAGRRFEELGAVVVDSDEVGHEVLAPEGEAYASVSERWPDVASASGIDRRRLGRIVFGSQKELRELEAMTHPAIARRIAEIADATDDLIVEVPLILELPGDWTTVYVDTAADRRLQRAVGRGLDEENVRQRMRNQPDRHEWLEWADRIVDNNGTPEQLAEQVDGLWMELKA